MKSHVLLFAFAGLFSIAVILLHESAHYLVAAAYGFERHFHFARIWVPPDQFTSPLSFFLVVAAGPFVDAAFTVGGFFWLRRLRCCRLDSVATSIDWLATLFVLCATRWLRCFTGTLSDPRPQDEALISGLFWMPNWLLPYALAPLAAALIVAAVRLHPKGSRLLPFASALVGIMAGRFVWMNHLGPRLLP